MNIFYASLFSSFQFLLLLFCSFFVVVIHLSSVSVPEVHISVQTMLAVWHFISESILVFLFHSAQSLTFLDQFLKDNWSLSLTALCLSLVHREYREHGRKLPSDCRRHLQERRFCGWTCTDTKLVTVKNLVSMEGCTAVFSFLFFIRRIPWLVLSSCTDFKKDNKTGFQARHLPATGTEIMVLKTSKSDQTRVLVSLFPSSFLGGLRRVGCFVGGGGGYFFVAFLFCLFVYNVMSGCRKYSLCHHNCIKRNVYFFATNAFGLASIQIHNWRMVMFLICT